MNKCEYKTIGTLICRYCNSDYPIVKNNFSSQKKYQRPFMCSICGLETDRGFHRKITTLVKSDNNRKKETGYVYFLKIAVNGHTFFKIGKTTNKEKRLKAFPVKFPLSTELFKDFYVNDITLVERLFHKLFKDKRREGEWFELDYNDCELIKKRGLLLLKDAF